MLYRVVAVLVLVGVLAAGCGGDSAPESAPAGDAHALVLATTTSPYDSGLLPTILPDFEQKFDATVKIVAVGTGQALALAANGDADVVLVHAREREEAFVAAGDGTRRYDVMVNDFVIAGPPDDPARIRGMTSAAAAFQRIADSRARFVSRGDDSGTYIREQAIWAGTTVDLSAPGDWYLSAGQGMGAVLTMTGELQAYTLSDRSTYLKLKAEGLALDVLVEGDPVLINPYSVIPVNPAQHPGVNAQLAQDFADWITSLETQRLIASFTVDGQQLFAPNSAAWHAAQPSG